MKKANEPATPALYLDEIEEPRKSEMKAVHSLIRKAVPDLKPGMHAGMIGYGTYHYKYASGGEGDWPVISLANRKNYISVYVCGVENGEYIAERRKKELPKASIGKSCIRFKRLSDIDLKTLESIVREAARVTKQTSG